MTKAILLVLAACVAVSTAATFTYPDPGNGGNGWGGTCLSTVRQSPINIETDEVTPATISGKYRYWQPSLGTTTSEIKRDENGNIVLDLLDRDILFTSNSLAETYEAQDMTFHTPSEHTINGDSYDLEVQIMHASAQNAKLVIVSILFEEGAKADPLLEQFMEYLATNPAKDTEENVDFVPKIYFPNQFYEYDGSLTVPPCTENVHWMISTKVRSASEDQIKAFKAVLTSNARGIQLNAATPTVTEQKYTSGSVIEASPFLPPNTIAPTYVETILPAGNRVLIETSQAQSHDIFGIHESQISNLWTDPVGYEDDSGIDAETGVIVAVGDDVEEGHEWDEGSTVIFDPEDCETVGLNGILYHLCEAESVYGEISTESWGSNRAHQFTAHLSANDQWQLPEIRHRTF